MLKPHAQLVRDRPRIVAETATDSEELSAIEAAAMTTGLPHGPIHGDGMRTG
jgi:hypothetical protein